MTKLSLEEYLKATDLPRLLHKLGTSHVDLLVKEISHFTKNEATRRDKIVLGYFGEEGVERIIDTIIACLTSSPKLEQTANILDVGAGSGFFTTRIVTKMKKLVPDASFYAMDATPSMLLALAKKRERIVPFFGVAENIAGSIENAQSYATVPDRFDAAFSTLMLHHCPQIETVFKSLKQVLKTTGKAVIVDLCTHTFAEFKDEMGDVHLGFDPDAIRKTAKMVFSGVSVEKLPGISCTSSGCSAELFVATLRP